jgi:murein DD-endopeptidase MepM/ murein hydrolase activator NlpD
MHQFASIAMLLFCMCMMLFPSMLSAENAIGELSSLTLQNPVLKQLRTDVAKTTYTIKSLRGAMNMPELQVYRYKVAKGDTFWTILSATSSNIDTLMSLNGLGSPEDIQPGKTIFIPNMRGIVFHNSKRAGLEQISSAFKIPSEYILRANGNSIAGKEYLFIPLAKLSSVERSLFLGTGFVNPLRDAKKTSGFGLRRDPITHHMRFHGGIDLACNPGTKVYAARSGVVTFAGYKGNYGFAVEVSHSHGYSSIYGHLSKIHVRPGTEVNTNTILGLSGNTGRSTGPHLHFEVRRRAHPINPNMLSRQ